MATLAPWTQRDGRHVLSGPDWARTGMQSQLHTKDTNYYCGNKPTLGGSSEVKWRGDPPPAGLHESHVHFIDLVYSWFSLQFWFIDLL